MHVVFLNPHIHTNVNPCITCTKHGGAEQKMIPSKDAQGAAFFERQFRAQETNAPHGCGLERHFSSMLRGRLERPLPVERSAAPGQARAAPIEHSAVPGRLERRPSRLHGRLERHASSILWLRGRLERPVGPGCMDSGQNCSDIF